MPRVSSRIVLCDSSFFLSRDASETTSCSTDSHGRGILGGVEGRYAFTQKHSTIEKRILLSNICDMFHHEESLCDPSSFLSRDSSRDYESCSSDSRLQTQTENEPNASRCAACATDTTRATTDDRRPTLGDVLFWQRYHETKRGLRVSVAATSRVLRDRVQHVHVIAHCR